MDESIYGLWRIGMELAIGAFIVSTKVPNLVGSQRAEKRSNFPRHAWWMHSGNSSGDSESSVPNKIRGR